MQEVLKRCTTCNKDLKLDNFRKQSKNKDGLKYTCRECDDQKAKKRYCEKKQEIISTVRNWQTKNAKKVKSYKRRYSKSKYNQSLSQEDVSQPPSAEAGL